MATDTTTTVPESMSESFEGTPIAISPASIPRALERAMRYRLLNDPEQAESICLDILEVEPANQEALVTLILALTDQFGVTEPPPTVAQVREYVDRLESEYQRHYYTGIICERRARAFLRRPMGRAFAFEAFREAMTWFETGRGDPPGSGGRGVAAVELVRAHDPPQQSHRPVGGTRVPVGVNP